MINLLFTIILFNGITGKIQGSVNDKQTGEPIPLANVIIMHTEMGAATDEDGNFFIMNVRPGKYTVEVSCIGYQTQYVEDVIVEIDQTTRLSVSLKETAIEMAPITVTSERPSVKKDMVGTTYIVRKTELAYLPVDYAASLVTFQPSVARIDTALHVRGGRATEVLYMIDNVSIIDPQTGDFAINISKGIVDEVIFLPGGFDVEYGRAMSGVINLITEYPSDNLKFTAYGKTERIMPFYYDFGYENFQSSIHLPISRKFKGLISLDVMHTDDWDPRLYILPHKQRDDYSLYGKWIFAPSGKFKFALSGAKSRTQFDRYTSEWKFNIDNYRSDMRQGDLEALNISYLPDSRTLFNLTLSRLYTDRIFGVTEESDYGIFENFSFLDYLLLEWPMGGVNNPFGAYVPYAPMHGHYPWYQDKSSLVYKVNLNTSSQVHRFHELRAGIEYTYQDLKNFTYYVSDTANQLIDEYQHKPTEYSFYFQDNIDHKGLYAKVGCRYDYFFPDIEGFEPKTIISPRFGFSFMVTEKFLFRTNIGMYAQPPLYDYMYGYYSLLPLPAWISPMPLVGNPDLEPEKTLSYEIGLQGEVSKNLLTTVNLFYKDVSDLIGTRLVYSLPANYVSYFNVERANVRGIEAILEFANSVFNGKVSYTLSYAKGTSSYAAEVYDIFYVENPDATPEAVEYFLDFDQRHRFFIQGDIALPLQTRLYLFGYFGKGFPYTPPGPEGELVERNIDRLPDQRMIDCVITKSFKIGNLSMDLHFEVINLLDERYEIATHYPWEPLEDIYPWDFNEYYSIFNPYYHPSADFNHDALITPYEEYLAYRALMEDSDDWVNAFTAPRRARIGITINFR